MPRNSYLQTYLKKISDVNPAMGESIGCTARNFKHDYLDTFSFDEDEVGLLFGNVQAGKTAQMFGILCAAAEKSFSIFIILTPDNIVLHNQTYDRTVKDLSCCNFCICGEADKQKFVDNNLERPVIIVLKKNSKVLLQWYNTLAASSFVRGNALFIIDDEADAASPNTLVNQRRISTINKRLTAIKDSSIGSIYLQVTGTPQALLLQSSVSDFRPNFTCYFEPGESYLGGDFFFSPENACIRFIQEGEERENDEDVQNALICHLLSSAQLFLDGKNVCNFVIHPGVRQQSHIATETIIKAKLRELIAGIDREEIKIKFYNEYLLSQPKHGKKHSFDSVYNKIKEILRDNTIKVLVMNGNTNITEADYSVGSNVIIGGNVLGRGVTFPKLQTLYYTRTAKKPQADTMWQHSRMFGYDRDPGMMRVFITKPLFKLFSDINAGNNSIIAQVESGFEKIQIAYPEWLNPTRRNVIDFSMVDFVAGGTSYFPNDPMNDTVEAITKLLSRFESIGYNQVTAKLLLEIFDHIIPSEDFNKAAFENVIKSKLAEKPAEQAILIVRRDREVSQGTGSLISPNDRIIADSFPNQFVLTMYQICGDHGWKQPNIWVPNIKLPQFLNYYDVH